MNTKEFLRTCQAISYLDEVSEKLLDLSYVNLYLKYPIDTKGFGARLKELLDKKKLSKHKLSEMMGKENQGSVTGWFKGSVPRGDQLYILSHIVDVGDGPWQTMQYLLTGKKAGLKIVPISSQEQEIQDLKLRVDLLERLLGKR